MAGGRRRDAGAGVSAGVTRGLRALGPLLAPLPFPRGYRCFSSMHKKLAPPCAMRNAALACATQLQKPQARNPRPPRARPTASTSTRHREINPATGQARAHGRWIFLEIFCHVGCFVIGARPCRHAQPQGREAFAPHRHGRVAGDPGECEFRWRRCLRVRVRVPRSAAGPCIGRRPLPSSCVQSSSDMYRPPSSTSHLPRPPHT